MPDYKLQVLKMGQCEVPGPEVFWMSRWFEWETLYFYMVVIRGSDFTALINTGPPADLTELNTLWKSFAGDRCQMRRADTERPQAALASLGYKPEDVTHILITPLVSYADANIPLFPNVQKIFISRRGWIEDYAVPLWTPHVPRRIFVPDEVAVHLTMKVFDRLRFVGDEEEVLPGIRMFWTGVHHRSSMAVSIPTRMGRVIVSDCFFKYGNIEDGHPIPLVYDTTTVLLRGGRRITGIAKNEDEFSVQLLGTDQELHLLLRKNLKSVVHERKSLMPVYSQEMLSHQKLRDLVAYLETLRGNR